MGFLSPKYPKGAEPSKPAKRESRGARKDREFLERYDAATRRAWKDAHRASKERSARFWDDYDRRNGAAA